MAVGRPCADVPVDETVRAPVHHGTGADRTQEEPPVSLHARPPCGGDPKATRRMNPGGAWADCDA